MNNQIRQIKVSELFKVFEFYWDNLSMKKRGYFFMVIGKNPLTLFINKILGQKFYCYFDNKNNIIGSVSINFFVAQDLLVKLSARNKEIGKKLVCYVQKHNKHFYCKCHYKHLSYFTKLHLKPKFVSLEWNKG